MLALRDRERLHLASVDPDTTAILSRHVQVETAVAAVAAAAMALAGGIMVAVQAWSSWWGLLPFAVAAALVGGVRARSRRWVSKVRRSLLSPAHASICSARFARRPLRRYSHLPGPVYAEIGPPIAVFGCQQVPLMGCQRLPSSVRQQPVTVTLIAGSRSGWPPTVIIVDDMILFASPAQLTSRVLHLFQRT